MNFVGRPLRLLGCKPLLSKERLWESSGPLGKCGLSRGLSIKQEQQLMMDRSMAGFFLWEALRGKNLEAELQFL